MVACMPFDPIGAHQYCWRFAAGPGVQLPWNWKLLQIQNPFAQQWPNEAASKEALSTPARTAEPLPSLPNATPAMSKMEAGCLAPTPEQKFSVTAEPAQKQNTAGQFQWPGWGKDPAESSCVEASASPADAVKPLQKQQGAFLGLQLPKLKNPFEGWGQRVAPSSG